ncbi:MAG: hypothetical protein WC887_02590 [Candidatus Paceibacterota bacterium]|jgi:hypothetical protein
MSKISVDLRTHEGKGKLISEESITAVTSGCQQAYRRLGKLGNTIEAFRVTFGYSYGNHDVPGPFFKVYLHDPFGKEYWYEFDYYSIGSKRPNPTALEIADAICANLPVFISKHLEFCMKTVENAQIELETRREEAI